MTRRSRSSGTDGAEPIHPNQARGRWGESLAAADYERRGYRILDRNWRSPTGEIDLVVGTSDVIAIVEVKARRTDAYGPPGAAVGETKQRRLRLLAREWLAAHDHRARHVRFDVVAITGTRLEVIEAAF